MIHSGKIDIEINFGKCSSKKLADIIGMYYEIEKNHPLLQNIVNNQLYDKKYIPAYIIARVNNHQL